MGKPETIDVSEPSVEAQSSPPPRDQGRPAWTVLAAVSFAFALTWGFGTSFGVFRSHYFHHGPLAGNQLVASTGVIELGILQMTPPFLLRYLISRPQHQKPMMWIGMVLVVAASLGAAFSTTPSQVILTQGAMYGIGSGLLAAPSMAYIDDWFLERRGLANGIYFGCNNLSAAIGSPIFAIVLRKYGPRVLLIAWAIIAGTGISLSILFVKPRTRPGAGAKRKQDFSWQPFKTPLFWILAFAMLLQGLGNFLPAVYLPTYGTDLGFTATQGGLLVTFLSLGGIVGPFPLGWLTDKIGGLVPLLLSTTVSTMVVLVLWGLGRQYWMLVLLSVLFAACAFSYPVFRSHMAAAVVGDKLHPREELVVSGALLATRGIACIVSGPAGAAVVGSAEHLGVRPGYGAGKWRSLVIYVGVLSFGASIGALAFVGRARKLSWRKEEPDSGEATEASGTSSTTGPQWSGSGGTKA